MSREACALLKFSGTGRLRRRSVCSAVSIACTPSLRTCHCTAGRQWLAPGGRLLVVTHLFNSAAYAEGKLYKWWTTPFTAEGQLWDSGYMCPGNVTEEITFHVLLPDYSDRRGWSNWHTATKWAQEFGQPPHALRRSNISDAAFGLFVGERSQVALPAHAVGGDVPLADRRGSASPRHCLTDTLIYRHAVGSPMLCMFGNNGVCADRNAAATDSFLVL